MILIGIIIGTLLTVLGYKYLPKFFNVIREYQNKKTFEVKFNMTFLVPPNLSTDIKGKLIKSETITMRFSADDEDDAREVMTEIVFQEMKIDLVSLKEVDQ